MKVTAARQTADDVDIDLCGDEIEVRPLRKRDREEPQLNVNCKPDGTPIHPEGATYIGQVDADGYYTGLGEMTYPNDSVYTGNFLHGYYHGEGHIKYSNTSEYRGQFFNGLRHGKGIVEDIEGCRYEGAFLNDMCHGEGILTRKNGVKYIGSFSNHRIHGPIKIVCPDGMIINGNFHTGQLEFGPLEIICPDGSKFSGLPASLGDHWAIRKMLIHGNNDAEKQTEESLKQATKKPTIDLDRKIKAVFTDGKLTITDGSPVKKP